MLRSSRFIGQAVCAFRQGLYEPAGVQVRHLNIHEYQSKEIMERFGCQGQSGGAGTTADEIYSISKGLDPAKKLVVKAQVHAGGRGKGTFKNGFQGGVHIVDTAEEAKDIAEKMLGQQLVTKQTGEHGALCSTVLVVEAVDILAEKYFAILMDRAYNGPVLVGSPSGGMDIEKVAKETPELIFKQPIDILKGPNKTQLKEMARNLDFSAEAEASACAEMDNLYKLFIEMDCTQVEINPLVETPDAVAMCLDAKLNFDSNASFRHEELEAYRDPTQEDARELAAAEFDLNYIGLDGNIGCMVNGAGLAMATMDIISRYGGEPANFLDVGGGASEKNVTEAFKIIDSNPQVKGILVNIFGGIMKCDVIAQGIVNAVDQVGLNLPLVVRLEGTNVEQGKSIIKNSGLDSIISADDLDDAAQKAVAAIQ